MKIIISPAKKMSVDTDSLAWNNLPIFIKETEVLKNTMQGMGYDELKKLWKCNDSIAELNKDRLKTMDLHKNLTPAILSYEGIQYQHIAPSVFTQNEIDYIEEHLRILSGFYGILKPFDGITPYRLEMQAKLKRGEHKDLYSFWGDNIAKAILGETDCIINLASKEYSICVSKYLPDNVRFITCVFGENKDGKITEKGTICKMARGEMVRFMAQNEIKNPDDIKAFNLLKFGFNEELSDENTFVFLKK